jgi:hypothetical protein
MLPFNLEQFCFPTSKDAAQRIYTCMQKVAGLAGWVRGDDEVSHLDSLLDLGVTAWPDSVSLSRLFLRRRGKKGRSLDLHMHATTAVYALYCTRANTRSTASSCERQLSTYIHMLPYNLLRRRSMGRKLRHLIWNGRSACQLQLI